MLRPGGVFLTHQTGGNYDAFYDALRLPPPERTHPDWTLDRASEEFAAAGLRIADGAEAFEEVTFADAGAFAWYLRAIPWVIDGFTIGRHHSNLEQLHRRIERDGPHLDPPAVLLAKSDQARVSQRYLQS